ncbi:MAG: hypothetical protein K6A35_05655 [bacterium]|nr:hypothetical protein [bacterium]
MEEDLKKILDSLNDEEKALLPPSGNAYFLEALSLLLRMKGWSPEDVVEVIWRIRKNRYKVLR